MAGQLGLRVVVPLTDEWNYYHGGLHDFLGWRGRGQLEGVQDNCVCNMDQVTGASRLELQTWVHEDFT